MKNIKKMIIISLFTVLLFAAVVAIAETKSTAPEQPVVPTAAIALRVCDDLIGFVISYSNGALQLYSVDDTEEAAKSITKISKHNIGTLNLQPAEGCKRPITT